MLACTLRNRVRDSVALSAPDPVAVTPKRLETESEPPWMVVMPPFSFSALVVSLLRLLLVFGQSTTCKSKARVLLSANRAERKLLPLMILVLSSKLGRHYRKVNGKTKFY